MRQLSHLSSPCLMAHQQSFVWLEGKEKCLVSNSAENLILIKEKTLRSYFTALYKNHTEEHFKVASEEKL